MNLRILPSLAVASVSGYHQCGACGALGDAAIGDGDPGDVFCVCARCGRAAIVFHNPTVQGVEPTPARKLKRSRASNR